VVMGLLLPILLLPAIVGRAPHGMFWSKFAEVFYCATVIDIGLVILCLILACLMWLIEVIRADMKSRTGKGCVETHSRRGGDNTAI
jgi:hypothetical protein